MIGIVLATNEKLGTGLLHSVELILGSQEQLRVIELEEGDTLNSFQRKMAEAILRSDSGEGVLVLTDMSGGTPANATLIDLPHVQYRAVAGVNLPMLIEVLLRRETFSLPHLVEVAIRAGVKGITAWRVGAE